MGRVGKCLFPGERIIMIGLVYCYGTWVWVFCRNVMPLYFSYFWMLSPELSLKLRNVLCMCCRYMIHEKKWCEWYFYWLAISCRLEVDIKLLWFWSICKFPFIIYINKTDSWTHFFDANVLILSCWNWVQAFPSPVSLDN